MGLTLRAGEYYGSTHRRQTLAAINLTETTYQVGGMLPRHLHEQPYFCLVLQGSFTESSGRGSRTYGPTMLIYHPAGDAHSDRFLADTRCFNIQLPDHTASLPEQPTHFQRGVPTYLATKLYREFRQTDAVSALAIEGLALELIAEVTRAVTAVGRGSRPWLERVQQFLDDNFSESPTLADLSTMAGVHPTHLVREFRRRYGVTVGEYLRRRRIEFACRRLAGSNSSILQIACEAGFSDHSHFSRTFRDRTGITPAAYRTTFRSR